MSTCKLPAELCDDIISHCTDHQTLLSCALVCRSWIPASRSCTHARTTSLLTHRNSSKFHDLLLAPQSTMPTFITTIRIVFTMDNTFEPSWVVSIANAIQQTGTKITDLWIEMHVTHQDENAAKKKELVVALRDALSVFTVTVQRLSIFARCTVDVACIQCVCSFNIRIS